MLPLLASLADAAGYGYAVSEEHLRRASTRIRGFLQQEVTLGTSTVVGMGPSISLPQSPVVSVVSVKDAAGQDVSYERHGQRIDTWLYADVTVIYTHGLDVIPDEIVELTAAVASRMAVTVLAGPVTTDSYGDPAAPAQWQAQAGLTSGERAILRRYWPSVPRTISLGSPAAIWPRESLSRFDLNPDH